MSKETVRRPRHASRAKRNHPGADLPRVREMVDELHAVCNAVEAGARWSGSQPSAPSGSPPGARTPSPDEIRAIRDSLGLSQAGFADFLGTGLTTVRSWELGQREPSSLARRLLGAIRDDPAYWRTPCRG